MTIVTPPPAIERDRWGRPLVVPPNGGKKVAYTRCTTFIDCLDDKFGLQKWMMRMVALGLANRPDLLLSVSAHKDDKRELDRICDSAKEAAAASAAATTGTALHALTELVDRGETLPVVPDSAKASLDAYTAATAELKATAIEQFLVLDTLKIGGTTDRIVTVGGESYIADIKTGSIEYGALKIAMQLAVYARSYAYDIATGERTVHGASTTRGLIIHLPANPETWADPKVAECHLHWVDLEAGWEAVKVAAQVRDQRGLKFGQLTKPFDPDEAVQPSLRLEKKAETDAAKAAENREAALEKQIRACPTADAVRELWAANASEWTPHLTDVAKSYVTTLPAAVAG
jgi:hypothetical protein